MSTSPSNGSLSEFITHTSCEECGSSDGNSLYSDGHTFCFVCHTWKSGDGTIHNHTQRNVSFMESRGVPRRLSRRGISERICEEYGITTDGDILCFHYRDSTGSLIGIKCKNKDKEFWYEGKSDGRFFGQHLFRNQGKRVVITEGELDAATCREALPTWEMVSLPNGAAAAKKINPKKIWSGYKVGKKYVSFLITTKLADRLQLKQQVFCLQVRSLSLI